MRIILKWFWSLLLPRYNFFIYIIVKNISILLDEEGTTFGSDSSSFGRSLSRQSWREKLRRIFVLKKTNLKRWTGSFPFLLVLWVAVRIVEAVWQRRSWDWSKLYWKYYSSFTFHHSKGLGKAHLEALHEIGDDQSGASRYSCHAVNEHICVFGLLC